MGVRITDSDGNVIEDSDNNRPTGSRYDITQPEIGGIFNDRQPTPEKGRDLDLNIQPVVPDKQERRRDENPTPWKPFLH